jgi:hypothetical protein
MRFLNESLSNAFSLMLQSDSEIGKVAAIAKIRDRPRNANKLPSIPGGHDDVGMPQHLVEPLKIIGGTPFSES